MLVVLPENTNEVSKILSYCNKNKIKVVPRGAGTGLAGSALPLADCILLGLGKFNKIKEIDYNSLVSFQVIGRDLFLIDLALDLQIASMRQPRQR